MVSVSVVGDSLLDLGGLPLTHKALRKLRVRPFQLEISILRI